MKNFAGISLRKDEDLPMEKFLGTDDQGAQSHPPFDRLDVQSVAPAGPAVGKNSGGTTFVRDHENVTCVRNENHVPKGMDPVPAGIDKKSGGRKAVGLEGDHVGRGRGGRGTLHCQCQIVPDMQRKGKGDAGQCNSPSGGQCVNVHEKIRPGQTIGDQISLDRPSRLKGFRGSCLAKPDKFPDRQIHDAVTEKQDGEKNGLVASLSEPIVFKKWHGHLGCDCSFLEIRHHTGVRGCFLKQKGPGRKCVDEDGKVEFKKFLVDAPPQTAFNCFCGSWFLENPSGGASGIIEEGANIALGFVLFESLVDPLDLVPIMRVFLVQDLFGR
jgi:hypothetical protein